MWAWAIAAVYAAREPPKRAATSERGRQCYWDCRATVGRCRAGCAGYKGEAEQSICVASCENDTLGCFKSCPDVVPAE